MPSDPVAGRNKKIVSDFMAARSRGVPEEYLDYLAEDLVWWIAGSIEGISGTRSKQEYAELAAKNTELAAGGSVQLRPIAFTAEGDRVAVEAESHIELSNGKVYENTYHFLFVVRDGKISVVKEYMDTARVLAVFRPGAAS